MRRIEAAVSRELIGLELKRAGIPTVEVDRVKRTPRRPALGAHNTYGARWRRAA
jgi:hypothetical protein